MNAQDLHKLITDIAKKRLGVETLESQADDSFVRQLENALKDAFFAGRQAAIREMGQ